MKTIFTDDYDPKKVIKEADEYIYVKGGDGTLLRAIHKFSHLNKPFFGVAGGSLNFLMNNTKGTKPAKKHTIKIFRRIKVTVYYKKRERDLSSIYDVLKPKKGVFQAFNDVCIGGSDGMDAWINFEIEEKDKLFGEFKGGGLIISTPQGSTGINKTNRGTILPLSSNLWSITGDKTNHNIDYVIKPRKTIIKPTSRNSVMVWIDGSNTVLDNVEKVVIEQGDKIELIFNDYDEFKKKRRR